ncbi:MAG: hypothetical protein OXG33_04820 [Chloroflexi bacterium]|nr:hypothetical protein [Chloroflexota bacterium]
MLVQVLPKAVGLVVVQGIGDEVFDLLALNLPQRSDDEGTHSVPIDVERLLKRVSVGTLDRGGHSSCRRSAAIRLAGSMPAQLK